MNILFVCTGNTCRSPMAEALAGSRGGHQCSSAGIFAHEGNRASPLAVQVCEEQNLFLGNHRARRLNLEMMQEAHLILTMTKEHKAWIEQQYGKQPHVYTIGEYAAVKGLKDVADPFGGELEDYRQTRTQLKILLDAVWRQIQ